MTHRRRSLRCGVGLAARGALGRWRSASPSGAGPQVLRRRSARRASPRPRTPRRSQPWDIDLFIDLATEPVRRGPAIPTPNVRARNVNTIDEVPDSSWFTNRILAPAGHRSTRPSAARSTGDGPAPGRWTVIRAEGGRRRARASRCATRNGELWFVSFDAPRLSRSGDRRDPRRQQDLLGARLLAGRELPDHGPAGSARHRRHGDVHAALRQAPADDARRSRRRLPARASQRRRQLPRRRRPGRARASRSAASAITARAPTIRTTSCRTSTAASCAR